MKNKISHATCLFIATVCLIILASPIVAEPVSYKATESFFVENDRGSFTFVEVNLPKGKGPFPIVFLAHGFAGSIHSGGAMELSNKLSDAGIISIRCDWNAYLKPNKKSERANSYALRDMKSDYLKVMEYAFSHYNVDQDRVGIYGRSYGGRFAMTCANENIGKYDYKALCLVAPAGDDICFERFLGGRDRYEKLKEEANEKGESSHLKVILHPEWFEDVELYVPSKEGYKFKSKPVLLFYNTLDDIVYPDTSLRCADAYENREIIEITSTDGHGHEMGFKKSRIKNMIMKKIVKFYKLNL